MNINSLIPWKLFAHNSKRIWECTRRKVRKTTRVTTHDALKNGQSMTVLSHTYYLLRTLSSN